MSKVPCFLLPLQARMKGVTNVHQIGAIIDSEINRESKLEKSLSQAIASVLADFSLTTSMSIVYAGDDGYDVRYIDDEMRVRKTRRIPPVVGDTLAALLVSELKLSLPQDSTATAYMPLNQHSGIRWTLRKQITPDGKVATDIHARMVFPRQEFTLDGLIRNGTLTDEAAKIITDHLQKMRQFRIMFIGPPASGKTTMMNAVLREFYGLYRDHQILCYGDATDFYAPPNPIFVKPINSSDDQVLITRANCFLGVIGEIASPDAAIVMISMLNTYAGIFATLHALPSLIGARIASLAGITSVDIANYIQQNITLIVQTVSIRKGETTKRIVSEIWESRSLNQAPKPVWTHPILKKEG